MNEPTLSTTTLSSATLASLLAEHDNTVLIVDATDHVRVVESQSPVCMGIPVQDWVGRPLVSILGHENLGRVQSLIHAATADQPQAATLQADRRYALRVIKNGPETLIALRPLNTLSDNPATLRQLLEAMPDGIYYGDPESMTLHGYQLPPMLNVVLSPDQFVNRESGAALPPAVQAFLQPHLYNALNTQQIQHVDYIAHGTPETPPRRFDMRIAPLPDNELLLLLREVSPRLDVLQHLYQQEGLLRHLTETVDDLIVMYDSNGTILYINSAGHKMLGMPLGLGRETTFHTFLEPPYAAALHRFEAILLKQPANPNPIEIVLRAMDGTLLTLELRLTHTVMADRIPLFVAVGRDVGQRKRVEQALAMANLRYELLLNNAPEGLVVATPTGQIIDINPAFCNMLGTTVEETLGHNLTEFLAATPMRWIRHSETPAPPVVMSNSFETSLHRPDRTDLAVIVNSFFIDAGDEPFLYLIVRDVTSERLLQTWLQNSANHWQVLYEIDNAILAATSYERLVQIVIETLGKLIPADYCTMLLFDQSTETIQLFSLPSSRHATISSQRLPLSPAPIFATWFTGRLTNIKDLSNSHHRLPDELLGFLQSIGIENYLAVPILTDEGLVGVLGLASRTQDAFSADHLALVRNVASSLAVGYQQLTLKEQLRQYAANLEQKVHERTQELARLNDRLRELDQLKSMFVSDVSHELRTPVNNIEMRLHLLEKDRPDQQPYHLDRLKTQIQYLADLIEDILQLSRMDLGRSSITFQPVQLHAIVEAVVEANLPRAGLKKLQLTFQALDAHPDVLGERNQLSQVINNLVVNAINYTTSGYVAVYLRRDQHNKGLEIVVEDSGMGIPDEDKPRIFERFYRGRQVAKSNIAGTGLGLAIVQEIVQIHGGRIWLEDNTPTGTRFVVWLPIIQRLADIDPTEYSTE